MQLEVSTDVWRRILSHFFSSPITSEQAAFLFGRFFPEQQFVREIGLRLLAKNDFVTHEIDHLELTDIARSSLIKRAHDLNACLVELHSHPHSSEACFSLTDINGLRETVPHMHWRLSGRPYISLVVTQKNFDALVWLPKNQHPIKLDYLLAGEKRYTPTNFSLGMW